MSLFKIVSLFLCCCLLIVACTDDSPSDESESSDTETTTTLQLIHPFDTQLYEQLVDRIVLEWSYEDELGENEYFDVRIWQADEPHFGITWTKAPRLDLQNWILDQDTGEYFFSVAVIEGRDGQVVREVVKEVAPHTFTIIERPLVDYIPFIETGFVVEFYARGPRNPSVITFAPDGTFYVLSLSGDLWILDPTDNNETATPRRVYQNNDVLQTPVGLTFLDDTMYIADAGRISIFEDTDGDGAPDTLSPIVEDLPAWEYWLHSNNGLAFGADGKLYTGVGATTDHGPIQNELEASILRMNPDGSDLEVFASGFRNPYDLVFFTERRFVHG